MKKVLFSEAQRGRMRQMYEVEEFSLSKIAMNFGVSVPLIAMHLRDMGVTIRPKGRRPTKQSNKKLQPVEVPTPIVTQGEPTPVFDW